MRAWISKKNWLCGLWQHIWRPVETTNLKVEDWYFIYSFTYTRYNILSEMYCILYMWCCIEYLTCPAVVQGFFFVRGLITAGLNDWSTQPVLREELIKFRSGSITSGSVCLNKCVDKGSSTQVEDCGEEIIEISSVSL